MPEFTPVRAGRGRYGLRRFMRRRRRLLAVAAAVAATALLASTPRTEDGQTTSAPPQGAGAGADSGSRSLVRPEGKRVGDAEGATVIAPVRISDAATVRLLERNDRVDVIASSRESASARVVARNVRVADVPESGDTVPGDGALVVLAVPRKTATELVGAAATSRLAVTLC
ncbi:hypothetical protein [Streptomyces daliensis]|uniref:Flp pilus assembly protein RcpC/CpaB domain-containing protein n=1 Tax=Streptomyces daliensis TaxID=299421 RepID=A0A8T4IM51_9ACTN|nr:hypothetical protein [Streptomyces daliensis]